MYYKRRTFLKATTPFALFPLNSINSFFKSSPDLILYNANIITVDALRPRAQAIAIYGGRIMDVGTNSEIQKLAISSTKKVNVGGKTIIPGFIDAHSHPAYAGRAHLRNVDCDLRSIKTIKDAIAKKAKQTLEGKWVVGFKYDDTKTSEGRIINRFDLDEAAPAHPVFISHRGGHTAYVNSKALALAKITHDTPDPQGGKIGRDVNGELTGQLFETATDIVEQLIPNEFSRIDNQDAIRLITKMMAKTGVTSVTDAYGSPRDLIAFQDAHKDGELFTRIYCMIGYHHIEQMIKTGVRTGFGDEWVRIGAMKMTCDGSISERTARLSQPYVGRPNDYGMIVMDEDQLYQYAIKAHQADWQIGIHANGDVAIEKVLNLYKRLQKEYLRKDPRFRIEHCTVINKNIISQMKAMNVIPTPFSTYVYFHGEKMKEYGEERLQNMFAVRSFLDAGINVTQASDYPPGPFEPMMALQSSVTRTDMKGKVWGPQQKVTVEEAIKVGTLNGAYASYEERIKGSLQVGKLADLVILNSDPTKVDPGSLIDIGVERTMVGGKWVYES